MSRRLLVIAGLLAMFAASCSSGTPAATTSPPSSTGPGTTAAAVKFSKDVQPIFDQHCVVCHQGSGDQVPGGLVLASGQSWTNLVNVKSTESALFRVSPGHPEQSYIVNKLMGTQIQAGGIGAQMPYSQSPLTAAQINVVSQWIGEGAPNN
jgi:hypothetical protein